MMKRQVCTGLAGLVLASMLATPVMADTNTDGSWGLDDGKSQMKITVGTSYTVTIPASFEFTATGEQGAADNVVISGTSKIAETGTLRVKLANTNTLKASRTMTGGTVSEIPYSLAYGASKTNYTAGSEVILLEKTGADIVALNGLNTGVFATVTGANLNSALTAGDHLGTVDFEVTYTAP